MKRIVSTVTREKLYKKEFESQTKVMDDKEHEEAKEELYMINSLVDVLVLMMQEEYA